MQTGELLTKRIRSGLREELSAIDARPDALSRLRERIAQDRLTAAVPIARRRRVSLSLVMTAASCLVAILIAVGALVVLHASPHGGRPRVAGRATLRSPAVHVPGDYIALAGADTNGNAAVELVSSRTGRVYRTAATAHDAQATGAALSPNGRDLFYSDGGSQQLMRVDLRTGAATSIASDGQSAAVSPNGQQLAYVSEGRFAVLVVRGLITGTTRKINGLNNTLFPEPAITWLGDETDIAAIDGCATHQTSTICVTVVHLGPHGVTTRTFQLPIAPWTQGFAISGDSARPGSMMLATSHDSDVATDAGGSTVYRITLNETSASFATVGSIRNALPEAFDPSGQLLIVDPLLESGQGVVTVDSRRLGTMRRLKGTTPPPYAG